MDAIIEKDLNAIYTDEFLTERIAHTRVDDAGINEMLISFFDNDNILNMEMGIENSGPRLTLRTSDLTNYDRKNSRFTFNLIIYKTKAKQVDQPDGQTIIELAKA